MIKHGHPWRGRHHHASWHDFTTKAHTENLALKTTKSIILTSSFSVGSSVLCIFFFFFPKDKRKQGNFHGEQIGGPPYTWRGAPAFRLLFRFVFKTNDTGSTMLEESHLMLRWSSLPCSRHLALNGQSKLYQVSLPTQQSTTHIIFVLKK